MLNFLLGLFIIYYTSASAASVFGPHESKIIFSEKEGNVSYTISNTDKEKVWLVQSWIEDQHEKKTSDFMSLPGITRVESNSQPSIRIIKKGSPLSDRESLYWIVSHSIPAQDKQKNNTVNSARLTLALRFKVPMFYRPKTLTEKPQPEKLAWSSDKNGNLNVYNPTKYHVQIHHLTINQKKYDGEGVSHIIMPMTSAKLNVKTKKTEKIKYAIINDYGAIKFYDSVIE